jgi:beta-lactamase superfamily II metal-dependent hydrolase
MSNVAREVLLPSDPSLLLRVAFLYVGQGASTIILIADGNSYQVLLLDIHLDEVLGGVDVPLLMADLLDGGRLDAFVNSHPHNDHLCGVERLHEAISIDAIWHSGHIPSRMHQEAYRELQRVITQVRADGGIEEELCASRTPKQIGEVSCYVLSPAQHVKDSIDDETPEGRDRRIHEHCAVLRVGTGDTWIMLTGDADRDAWERHIRYYADYDALSSQVLAAAHHGSRTFFCYEEDDEPYLDGLVSVGPEYVVISAPKREESPHGHPHDLAVELYADEVGEENILHTGVDRHCFVADVYRDGRWVIWSDEGRLVAVYGLGGDGGGGAKSHSARGTAGPSVRRGRPRDVREAPPFA